MGIKGIILAAGRGSRMGELTKKIPKCKTIVNGKELLQWQLDSLNDAGIDQISLVRGYMASSFNSNLKYFDNNRWSETNMVVSLLTAKKWLESNDCIISYSDIIYSSNSIKLLLDCESDIAIAYDPNWKKIWDLRFDDPLSDAETFVLDGDILLEIGDTTNDIDSIEGQYMGLLKFSPKGWGLINNYLSTLNKIEIDRLDMTSMLQNLLSYGIKINAVPITDNWFEFDSKKDVEIFESLNNNRKYL